jgi:hypothetical protein
MGKTIVVLVLIAAAAYFVYQQTSKPASEEVQLVKHLEERYAVVVNKFLSASGRAGSIGMDTTFDSETAVVQIKQVQSDLAELQATLTEDKAIARADALAEKIAYFCKKNDITRP